MLKLRSTYLIAQFGLLLLNFFYEISNKNMLETKKNFFFLGKVARLGSLVRGRARFSPAGLKWQVRLRRFTIGRAPLPVENLYCIAFTEVFKQWDTLFKDILWTYLIKYYRTLKNCWQISVSLWDSGHPNKGGLTFNPSVPTCQISQTIACKHQLRGPRIR